MVQGTWYVNNFEGFFRSLHSRQGKRCCITRRQEVPGNRGAARSSHHVFGSIRPLPRSKISCSQTEGAPRVKRRMLHHRSWCSIQLGARDTTVQTDEDADTPFPNHARYSLRPANSFTESLVIQVMGCPEKVKVNGVCVDCSCHASSEEATPAR